MLLLMAADLCTKAQPRFFLLVFLETTGTAVSVAVLLAKTTSAVENGLSAFRWETVGVGQTFCGRMGRKCYLFLPKSQQ